MSIYIIIFAIKSKSLHPDVVGKVLGAVPDATVIKGDMRHPPRPAPARFGWYIEYKGKDSESITDGIIKLKDRIRPLLAKMPNLRSLDSELDVDISVNITKSSDDISIYIPKEMILFMAELQSSLDVDFF
jgi:hypothetical protein